MASTPSRGEETSDEAFVDALPKVELHVHLEGSIAPETLLELRRRHGLDHLPGTAEAVRRWYDFPDFDAFIAVYLQSVQALRDGEDFALLARTAIERLAAQGVRYAEYTVTPWLHAQRGIPVEEFFAGIEEGRAQAERLTGIAVRWIADTPGDAGREGAEWTLDALLGLDGAVGRRSTGSAAGDGGSAAGDGGSAAGDGGSVVGFGLAGPEVPRAPFAPVFARAREAGLHSLPHAGEVTGPESVWAALDDLGAERVLHGISALADPALVKRLRDEGMVLDVCPTSNVRTGAVADLTSHPLRALLEEGVAVTINSDDPPMFQTTLREEYLLALGPLGLSRAQLLDCVRTAVEAGFMPAGARAALLDELRAHQAR